MILSSVINNVEHLVLMKTVVQPSQSKADVHYDGHKYIKKYLVAKYIYLLIECITIKYKNTGMRE